MAVISVKEIWPGRGGADDIEKRTKYRHVYEVITSDPADDATVAGGTSLLPRLGDPHPQYADAYVVAVTPDQLPEDPTMWHVGIDYSSELPSKSAVGGSGIPTGPGPESQGIDDSGNPTNNSQPTDRQVNPLSRPAVIRRHMEEIEEPLVTDASGVAVKNSAGLPFVPPIMSRYRIIVLTFVKNVSGISNATLMQFVDTTNDATWKGIAAGKALVRNLEASSDLENGIAFSQVTGQIAITYRTWGWKRRVIDQGFYTLRDLGLGASAWDRIRDPTTGMARTEPSLLDGSGALLTPGSDPVVIEFTEFGSSSFSTLMSLLGMT